MNANHIDASKINCSKLQNATFQESQKTKQNILLHVDFPL